MSKSEFHLSGDGFYSVRSSKSGHLSARFYINTGMLFAGGGRFGMTVFLYCVYSVNVENGSSSSDFSCAFSLKYANSSDRFFHAINEYR